MPSPICASDFNKVNFGSTVCDLLKQLLLVGEKLLTYFSWAQDAQCRVSAAFVDDMVEILQPIGSLMYVPTDIGLDPLVWVLANGQTLNISDFPKLFAKLGVQFGGDGVNTFAVPNLSGRVLIGSGIRNANTDVVGALPGTISYPVRQFGGEDTVELTAPQSGMPDHEHGVFGVMNKQVPPLDTDGDKYFAKFSLSGIEVAEFTGKQIFDAGPFDIDSSPATAGFNRANITTTEITDIDLESDPGLPHNNMMPYFVGLVYIKAAVRLNGVTVGINGSGSSGSSGSMFAPPDIASITASEALLAGDFVNVYNSSGVAKVRKADASVSGKEATGFVLIAAASGSLAVVHFEGANTEVAGVSAGVVYLSATVPGGFTATPPVGSGRVVQRIGTGVSSTEINFEAASPVTLA